MRIVEQLNIWPTLIRLCHTLFMQQLKIFDPLYLLIVVTILVAFHLYVIQVQTRTAMGNSISAQAEQKSTKILLLECQKTLGRCELYQRDGFSDKMYLWLRKWWILDYIKPKGTHNNNNKKVVLKNIWQGVWRNILLGILISGISGRGKMGLREVSFKRKELWT